MLNAVFYSTINWIEVRVGICNELTHTLYQLITNKQELHELQIVLQSLGRSRLDKLQLLSQYTKEYLSMVQKT